MNKSDLTQAVATVLKVSHLQGKLLVDTVLDEITKGLEVDHSVTLTGFGTFEVKPRKERVGRNPHTGKVIQIPAGKRVTFHVGKGLTDRIRAT